MKLLAIADLFIPKEMMAEGLKELERYGFDIEVRMWEHKDIPALQEENIILEQQGSEAIKLDDSLLEGIEEFEYVITQFAPISKKVIDKAKKLKFLGVLRAGIENVNSKYAEEKGITVFNTMGRSNTSVSEFTVGLILSEIRNISRGNRLLREGKWEKYYPNGLLAPALKTSTVGLIGYGKIGQQVANLIRPFGGKVIFYDDYFNGETEDTQVSLEELIKEADIISMHYRLTSETKHMLDEKEFNQMKRNAVVINSARSGLINEKALISALQNKQITGAAVDVFDDEPLPIDHPYTKLDNVTITPHIAGSTVDNFANSPNIMVDRIIKEYLKK